MSSVLLVFDAPALILVLLSKPRSSPNLFNCRLASEVMVQVLLCKFAVIFKLLSIYSKVQYPGSNLTVVEP